MLELLNSRLVQNGAEVLELYRVAGYRDATDCYRLVWADAAPCEGRSKARLLDVRDYPATDSGIRRAFAMYARAR